MKKIRLYFLLMLLLMTISTQSQEINKLYIPDISIGLGENAVLPIHVQNSSNKITGIQFTLKAEKGVVVDINNASITERLLNHIMKVDSRGDNTYVVMIYSPDNTILTGNNGAVVNIPISLSDEVEVSNIKSIELSKVVLSDNLGKNVMTEFSSGKIKPIPTLTLKAGGNEVKEGQKIIFTITNEIKPSVPLDISISSDMPGHLKYPSSVTMEANSSTATFEVEAIDNGEVSDTLTASIIVSAAEHKSGESLLLIIDDDMPEIELELKPDVISEGDGLSAVIGKITRKTKTENKVTIVLSDDSNDMLYYSNKRISMPAGATEVEFTMGAIDNAKVEDERSYNVTAAVYIPSCSCSAKETSIGYVTKSITVTDDDGPTLKLTSTQTSVKEGASITFNVTQNVDSNKDITVNLSSDNDDAFEFDHNIIIPAGQKSKQVIVKAKENEIIDGNRTVVFTAKTDGYVTGTCWIQLTDQTLPDVSITNLIVTPSELEVVQNATLSVTLKNKGNAELPPLARVNFYFKENSKELGHAYTADAVAIDGELTLTYELEMPDIPGNYTLQAVVNEDRAIHELNYLNNKSQDVAIKLRPAFTATVQTDKNLYTTSEIVTFSGKAIGTKAANSDVEIYFINEGNRQTITTKTNDQGDYCIEYSLPKIISGHFIAGACYPNENLMTEMTSFDVYGLRLSDCSNNIEFDLGDTYQGTMTIKNAVNLKQTGLKVTQGATPDDCVFVFAIPETIEGSKDATLNFTITPSVVSTGRAWHKMPITITSNEGASTDYSINYYINSKRALLSTNVSSINTTMTKGVKRDYPITIKNVGKGETGKITLALPEWIKTSTPREMVSLAQGDSAIIVLQLEPTESMQLNVPVEGQLAINCENGSNILINFSITPVSESEGKLIIDVVDEFTFETQKAPHVSNAKIEVKRPTTGELIAQGNSGEDGKFTVTLPEGQYAVTITADNHEEYNNQIIVDAGKDNNHEAFVSYDAVTYSWDVVETEIEDSYEIETIVKYDSRVPKPVILISLPSERPEDGSIIPIVVTNKGIINAEDVNVSLAISGNWNIEFLTEPYLAKLSANQSEIFYVKLNSKNFFRARGEDPTLDECLSLQAQLQAHYICGNKYDNTVTANDLRRWGECLDYAKKVYSYGGGSGGSAGGPGGGGGGAIGGGGAGWWQIVPIPRRVCSPRNNNNEPDEPEEQECDKEPVLKYKLVPADGTRNEMIGVAADGVSQLKIVFDKGCKVPSDDCKWTCSWSLVDDNGKIGELLENKKSWDGVIYKAPVDFPVESGSEMTIVARNDVYKDGEYQFSVEQKIIIVRVPLVLLHGLNDSYHCFEPFAKKLWNDGLYQPYQTMLKDYKSSNCDHFIDNLKVAGTRIDQVLARYRRHGFWASQADLIGHSMGGILSRLHVQYVENKNVHKLITVNTPHSGSEIGDMMQQAELLSQIVNSGFLKKMDLFYSTDAIYDLAVNSYATDNFLNHDSHLSRMDGIPIHSVSTVVADGITNSIQQLIVGNIALKRQNGLFPTILSTLCNLGYTAELDASVLIGDLIVSEESQHGGLSGTYNQKYFGTFFDAFHCNSPHSKRVMDHLEQLLKSSVSSNMFYYKGFHPVDRKMNTTIFKTRGENLKIKKGGNAFKTKIESIDNDPDYITIHVNGITEDIENYSTIVYFLDDCFITNDTICKIHIPDSHSGRISAFSYARTKDNTIVMDSTFVDGVSSSSKPTSISCNYLSELETNDSILVTLNCIWADGSETYVTPENAVSNTGIMKYDGDYLIALKSGKDSITFAYRGSTCTCPVIVYSSMNDSTTDEEESSNSVCSTITLSFKQEMVMTRQAFRGTLTVNNGDAVNEMKDVKLNLEVKDEDGKIATSHEFQINAESLDGFEGELDLTAGWKLEAKGTGIATILFIPTKYAAPTESKKWSFGGTFSYTDPTTGLAVTKELYPVTLTVKPSPNLTMDYFMQRDVLGDDALTEDIVEPMIPAEFSLLINNKGNGDATNVKMVTNQPEIVDNEKGLLIDFEILSSQLNGGEKTLALGQSVATDFGTIPAGKTSYAQWWFTSTLLGHFTEYDVKATHLTSYGNPDLSLLDTVAVHELIHTLTIPKAETMRGFLVNDEKDSKDLPDKLYLTDGTVKAVAQASATLTDDGSNHFTLMVESTAAGWNYGNLIDPTNGHKVLKSVTRNSDGTAISLNNFWQTDRTLRDGKDPLYEYRLHFADEMAATGETYTLTFEDKPMTILDVESFVGASEEDGIIAKPIEKVTVYFNKNVASSTFNAEDIQLTCAGEKVDVSQMEITKLDEKSFELNLMGFTNADGYYVLTVQTTGIKDTEGFSGEYGRKTSWTQMVPQAVDMELEIPKGWSWISSNMIEEDKTDSKSFLSPIKNHVIRLVGVENELINDPVYGFVGKLTTIRPQNGYKLHVDESVKLSYSGPVCEPANNAINIEEGWNWIGYLPVNTLSVQEALKYHSPMENDILKGKDSFVTYSNGNWIGTLTDMKPGEGYMYYSGKEASFYYPKVYAASKSPTIASTRAFIDNMIPWQYDAHKYADNLVLIGKLYADNEFDTKEDYIVGAFTSSECCGVGKNIDGLIYLVIHGNISESPSITFRAFDTTRGVEHKIKESIVFDGQSLGQVSNPQEFHLSSSISMSDKGTNFTISPRPLKSTLYISGNIDEIESVRIISTSGKNEIKSIGYNQSGIDVGKLLPSVYIVAITTKDGQVYYEKVFKD